MNFPQADPQTDRVKESSKCEPQKFDTCPEEDSTFCGSRFRILFLFTFIDLFNDFFGDLGRHLIIM